MDNTFIIVNEIRDAGKLKKKIQKFHKSVLVQFYFKYISLLLQV